MGTNQKIKSVSSGGKFYSFLLITVVLICLLHCTFFGGFRSDPIPETHFATLERQCDYRDYIYGPGGEQSDPCLVALVRDQMLHSPSPQNYNITSKGDGSDDIPSNKEKVAMLKTFVFDDNSKRQKFFIECGANDGEFISPTLALEKTYGWTGLLIEGNPEVFGKLKSKHRKAWSINAAASTSKHAEKTTFYTNPKNTGLGGFNPREKYGVSVNFTVQCIPLYTMLRALNVTIVDFLSLDTEGTELAILKTIPFDEITFKVMSVEHGLIPEKRDALQKFLEGKGYIFVKEIKDNLTGDLAFIHESLKGKLVNGTWTQKT